MGRDGGRQRLDFETRRPLIWSFGLVNLPTTVFRSQNVALLLVLKTVSWEVSLFVKAEQA